MSEHPHDDKWFPRPDRLRDARVVEVIVVEHARGTGCCEKDPVRVVHSYYAKDGTPLAEADSFAGQTWEAA